MDVDEFYTFARESPSWTSATRSGGVNHFLNTAIAKIVLLGAWLMLVVRWENHRPQRVDLDSTIGSVVFGAVRFAHSGEES